MTSPRLLLAVLAITSWCLEAPSSQAQTPPVISALSPDGTHQFQPSATLSFTASSPTGVAINPSGISVQLTGTALTGQVLVTNLTGTNGLTVTGTTSIRHVTGPLTSNLVYTA